jgi:hypothetical protein
MRVSVELINEIKLVSEDDTYELPDPRFEGEEVSEVYYSEGGFLVVVFSSGERKAIAFARDVVRAVTLWRN